jgi:hypothetical protein
MNSSAVEGVKSHTTATKLANGEAGSLEIIVTFARLCYLAVSNSHITDLPLVTMAELMQKMPEVSFHRGTSGVL